MIKTIYMRALNVLMKKPVKLWGISLLSGLLTGILTLLFGLTPGIGMCLSTLVSTSMTMIFLHGYRGEEVNCEMLFECFSDWNTIKRVCLGTGWKMLWTFLWSLIPVVGPIFAIIRGYEYALVPYILVTEPEIGITDAIKVSKERTNGYKGKMFGADVLLPLCYFAATLVLMLLSGIPYLGFIFGLVNAVLGIAYGALSGLFNGLVDAAFYEEISNPTIPVTIVGGPAATTGATKFCPECGSQISADAVFCPNCGHKMA